MGCLDLRFSDPGQDLKWDRNGFHLGGSNGRFTKKEKKKKMGGLLLKVLYNCSTDLVLEKMAGI